MHELGQVVTEFRYSRFPRNSVSQGDGDIRIGCWDRDPIRIGCWDRDPALS